VHDALPRVAGVVGLAALATGLLAWLPRDSLFHRDDPAFPILVACVTLGAGFIGVVRGGLSARHQFVTLAVVFVAENASRCLGAVALILANVKAAIDYGICLAAGSFIGLLWPSSFRFARQQGKPVTDSSFRFIGGAAGGQLLGQAVLTGGPVLLALSGGTAAQVTALFAALALFRAPYTVAIALVSTLTGRLTTLFIHHEHAALRRVRVGVLTTTALVVPLAGVLGALAGPRLLELIFGPDVTLDPFYCGLVAAGSALALANLVMTVMIMSQNRSGAVARGWVVATLAATLIYLLSAEPPLATTCWVFLGAEAVALLALVLAELRGSAKARKGGSVTPKPITPKPGH